MRQMLLLPGYTTVFFLIKNKMSRALRRNQKGSLHLRITAGYEKFSYSERTAMGVDNLSKQREHSRKSAASLGRRADFNSFF